MRIVVVTAAFPSDRSEQFLIPELLELVQLGFEVTVVPTRKIGRSMHLPEELTGKIRLQYRHLLGPHCLAAFAVWLLRTPRELLAWLGMAFASGSRKGFKNLVVTPKAIWLASTLRKDCVEHVHAHWGGTSSTIALLGCRLASVKWSLTCHSWDIPEDNLLGRKCKEAEFSRFISQRGMKRAIALGAPQERCCVITMGTGSIANAPAPVRSAGETFQLACPASFDECKGHVYLLAAAAILRDRGRRFAVTLLGDGPLRKEILAGIGELNLDQYFEVAGFVPHSDLIRRLSGGFYHAVVLPSIVDSRGFDEGIPVSLMEAMGFGVPVISTRTGSIPELLPDELGLTVQQKDPLALADALERLMLDADWYRSRAAAVLAVVRDKWTAAAAARQLASRIRGRVVFQQPAVEGVAP